MDESQQANACVEHAKLSPFSSFPLFKLLILFPESLSIPSRTVFYLKAKCGRRGHRRVRSSVEYWRFKWRGNEVFLHMMQVKCQLNENADKTVGDVLGK